MAQAYAVGLWLLMISMAGLFADRQNAAAGRAAGHGEVDATAPGVRVSLPPEPPDPNTVARGREVFVTQGCLRCHRVGGEGSPRSPLDGVGARLYPEEIQAYVVADDEVRGGLPPSAARTKAAFTDLPDDDLRALVAYLATLRGGS